MYLPFKYEELDVKIVTNLYKCRCFHLSIDSVLLSQKNFKMLMELYFLNVPGIYLWSAANFMSVHSAELLSFFSC